MDNQQIQILGREVIFFYRGLQGIAADAQKSGCLDLIPFGVKKSLLNEEFFSGTPSEETFFKKRKNHGLWLGKRFLDGILEN